MNLKQHLVEVNGLRWRICVGAGAIATSVLSITCTMHAHVIDAVDHGSGARRRVNGPLHMLRVMYMD